MARTKKGTILPKRPELAEVGEPGGTVAVRTYSSTYPSHGLTPSTLTAILKEADRGDILRQAELFEEMEEKDAHLAAVLQTRKLALVGLPWEIEPASDDAADVKVAEFVREALAWIPDFDDAIMDLADAIGKGFSAVEILWELEGGRVWPAELKWRHPKAFTFQDRDGLRVLSVPRMLTEAEPMYGEDIPPRKFIIWRYRGRSGFASRAGVLRPCAWMWLLKAFALKDRAIYSERHAMPLRIGTYGPGAGEPERKVLRDALFNLGADAAAMISESTKIDFLGDEGKGSTTDLYERTIESCDKALSKAVLGHEGSAESTPGQLGESHSASDVRADLLRADSRSLSSVLNAQLIGPLVAFNFGEDVLAPRFVFRSEEPEDLNALADRIETLRRAGLAIPQSYVLAKFNIPAAEGDEPLLVSPAAAPFSGFTAKEQPPVPAKHSFISRDLCGCGREHARLVALSATMPPDLTDDGIKLYKEAVAPALDAAQERMMAGVAEAVAAMPPGTPLEAFQAGCLQAITEAYSAMPSGVASDAVRRVYGAARAEEVTTVANAALADIDLAFGGSDVRVLDFLATLDDFYLSKFITQPDAQAALLKALKEMYLNAGEGLFGRGDPAAISELQTTLAQLGVEISAAKVDRIAETAIQRARSWGGLSGMQDVGIEELRVYEPTMDCPYCAAMNGRVVGVAKAYARMIDLAGMTPEQYTAQLRAHPPVLDGEGVDPIAVIEQAVMRGDVPPYHPHCRGRVIKQRTARA